MQHEIISLTLNALAGVAQPPTVAGLQSQADGGLIVAAAFAHPFVQRLEISPDGQVSGSRDLKLEEEIGNEGYGVSSPLRNAENGDATFVVLHPGSAPKFLRRLLGKDISTMKGDQLLSFLAGQDTDMGFFSQHSICKYRQGGWELRRFQEPGHLWDVAFIGDFVFGLRPKGFYREPYLHLQIEKREFMRKDLLGNRGVHRSSDGTFWMNGANLRLVRFQSTEHKAKPTPRALPGAVEGDALSGFTLSAPSHTDGWLYGVSGKGSNKLFRVRRNPVSFEEELQELASLDAPITGLCVVESPAGAEQPIQARAIASVARPGSAELISVALYKPEDPEELPKVEAWSRLGVIDGVPCVSSLTHDLTRPGLVWAAEGDFARPVGSGTVPRLIKFKV
jgi:hypothetical protein